MPRQLFVNEIGRPAAASSAVVMLRMLPSASRNETCSTVQVPDSENCGRAACSGLPRNRPRAQRGVQRRRAVARRDAAQLGTAIFSLVLALRGVAYGVARRGTAALPVGAAGVIASLTLIFCGVWQDGFPQPSEL